MFKTKFLFLILIFFVFLGCSGCRKETPIILFNHDPITKENVLDNSRNFFAGERIHYLFITETPIKSPYIRVQIIKQDEKVAFWGKKLVYAEDYKVYKDQVYYYNDYIVLREAGHYFMQIFAKENLNTPLVLADFYVHKP